MNGQRHACVPDVSVGVRYRPASRPVLDQPGAVRATRTRSRHVLLNSPTAEEAGCPNDNNWTVTLGGATWTASYVVYQPFPNLIDSLSFDF